MIWQPEIEEMERRRAFALSMGGEESVARQHGAGRLTARERLSLLLDETTVREPTGSGVKYTTAGLPPRPGKSVG